MASDDLTRFGCYWASGWVEESFEGRSLTLPAPTFFHLGSQSPVGFVWHLSAVPYNTCPTIGLGTSVESRTVSEMTLGFPSLNGTWGYNIGSFEPPLDLSGAVVSIAITRPFSRNRARRVQYAVTASGEDRGWDFTVEVLDSTTPRDFPTGAFSIEGDLFGESPTEMGYRWDLTVMGHRFRGALVLRRFVQAGGFSTQDMSPHQGALVGHALETAWLCPSPDEEPIWRAVRIASPN